LVGTAAASVSDDPIMTAKALIPLSVIFALLPPSIHYITNKQQS
jgi:hypothetical protein